MIYILTNVLTTTRRNLAKNKFYFLFNVCCFSLGISSFLFIYSLYNHESCYDCNIPNYERVFRIQTEVDNGSFNSIGAPLAVDNVLSQFTEVEASTRISYIRDISIKLNDSSEELFDNIAFVDDSYFDILNIAMKCSNGEDKITLAPYEIVLSERVFKKLYGVEVECHNNDTQLILNDSVYLKVVGVMENPPTNSNFPLEMICSINILDKVAGNKDALDNWLSFDDDSQILVLLNNKDNKQYLEARFPNIIDSKIGPGFSRERKHYLVNISDVYSYGGYHDRIHQADKLTLLLFTSFCILLICLFNFINISLFLAKSRLKEVAVRKLYSYRNTHIVFLFFADCLLVVLGALLVSVGLLYILFPSFKQTFQVPFDVTYIFTPFNLVLVISALAFLVILATSLLSVSSIRHNIPTLLNNTKIKFGKLNMVTAIIIMQFIISQFLIFSSIIISSQLEFMYSKDLGFSYEDVVTYSINNLGEKGQIETIRHELSSINGIDEVSFSFDLPYSNDAWVTDAEHISTNNDINVFLQVVDYNFHKVYALGLTMGSWIRAEEPDNNIVVNEQFIKNMNIPLEEAIGSQIRIFEDVYAIKGVVNNFHHQSLHDPLEPVVFTSSSDLFKVVNVKLASKDDLTKVVNDIDSRFTELYGERPTNGVFLSDVIEQGYFSDKIYFEQIMIFSIVSLILNCMSIFSLSSLLLEHKREEVFIRKAFGATSVDLFKTIYSKFYVYNAYLLILTIPISILMTKSWLSNFTYRTGIEISFYIIGIVIIFMVYSITIILHILKNRLNFQINQLSKV